MAEHDSTSIEHATDRPLQLPVVSRNRRGQAPRLATAQIDEGLLHGTGAKPGFVVGVGGENIESQHHIGLVQLRRGFERVAR